MKSPATRVPHIALVSQDPTTWRWTLTARNGRTFATSPYGFSRPSQARASARSTISRLRRGTLLPTIYPLTSPRLVRRPRTQWTWAVFGANGSCLLYPKPSGGGWSNRSAAARSVASLLCLLRGPRLPVYQNP